MLFDVRCRKRAAAHLSLQVDIGLLSFTIRVLHCIKEWNWTLKLCKWDMKSRKSHLNISVICNSERMKQIKFKIF